VNTSVIGSEKRLWENPCPANMWPKYLCERNVCLDWIHTRRGVTKMYTTDGILCLLAIFAGFSYYLIGKAIEKRLQRERIYPTVKNPLNDAEYEEVEMREVNDHRQRDNDV
jgi:hypothetical protein